MANAELRDVRPEFVSLVPKGANRKPIKLYKANDAPEGGETEPAPDESRAEKGEDGLVGRFVGWVSRLLKGDGRDDTLDRAAESFIMAVKGGEPMKNLQLLVKEMADEIRTTYKADPTGTSAKVEALIRSLQELHRSLTGGKGEGKGDTETKAGDKKKDAEGDTTEKTAEQIASEKAAAEKAEADRLAAEKAASDKEKADLKALADRVKELEGKLSTKDGEIAEKDARISTQAQVIKDALLGSKEPAGEGETRTEKTADNGKPVEKGADPFAAIDGRRFQSVARRSGVRPETKATK